MLQIGPKRGKNTSNKKKKPDRLKNFPRSNSRNPKVKYQAAQILHVLYYSNCPNGQTCYLVDNGNDYEFTDGRGKG